MFKFTLKPIYLLNGWSISSPVEPRQILLAFLAVSFAISGVDVALAHSQNHFIPKYEWIPIIYSPLAALAAFMYLIKSDKVLTIYKVVMISGMIMGVVGTCFHLFGNMTLNQNQPVNWLVFGAPIFAPMAFTGMSLYGLALVNAENKILLRLVGLGFLVIALTAAFDHAQTHFENQYTFLPIVAGILAFMIVWLCSGQSEMSLSVANLFYAVMTMMILTGLLGFCMHVLANLEGTIMFSWPRMLYNAPALAPLLFAQLGTLGILSSLQASPTKLTINNQKRVETA